jgi:hypothetical protein
MTTADELIRAARELLTDQTTERSQQLVREILLTSKTTAWNYYRSKHRRLLRLIEDYGTADDRQLLQNGVNIEWTMVKDARGPNLQPNSTAGFDLRNHARWIALMRILGLDTQAVSFTRELGTFRASSPRAMTTLTLDAFFSWQPGRSRGHHSPQWSWEREVYPLIGSLLAPEIWDPYCEERLVGRYAR